MRFLINTENEKERKNIRAGFQKKSKNLKSPGVKRFIGKFQQLGYNMSSRIRN